MNRRQAKKLQKKYYEQVVAFKNYLTINMNNGAIDEQDLWHIILLRCKKPEKIDSRHFVVINNVIRSGGFLGWGDGEDAEEYYAARWLMPTTCDVMNSSWGKHGPKLIRSAIVYDIYDERKKEVF